MDIRSLLTSLSCLTRKEVARFSRIWLQSMLPPAISTSLYFMIFGGVIGPRIGQMAGFDYMTFITPGLIIMAIINNSYANVVSSFYGARFSRSIEEILVSPMSMTTVILGYSFGGLGRGLMVGLIVSIVSQFFVSIEIAHPFMVFVTIVLCSFLFSLAGLINGIFSRSFDDNMIISTFFLSPLTYLGGVFYDIKELPLAWQNVAILNPIYHLIELFRYSMLGASSSNPWSSVIAILLSTLFFFLVAYFCLRKGVGIRT